MTIELGDCRFTDLWPGVPMANDFSVQEIYADAIADLKLHNGNFTATYFVWGRSGPCGLLQRIPVVKIIRPCTSIMDVNAKLAAMVNEGGPGLMPH